MIRKKNKNKKTEKAYTMKNKKFEEILRATQTELYDRIFAGFKNKVNMYYRKGSYILVEGEAPILLIAHLDTVHEEPVKDIVYNDVTIKNGITEKRLSSPQGIGGDDRCGVYAILSVYERAKEKPWLLFVCDEEIGCVGSGQFVDDYKIENTIMPEEFDNIKFMIEIDRKGKDDAVYYECDNKEFEEYINSFGFFTEYGSYSDICEVAPAMHKAAVNLSSGYYNAHTVSEYIVETELEATIDKVNAIVADSVKEETPSYEYIEAIYNYDNYLSLYNNTGRAEDSWYWWDWDDDWTDSGWKTYEYHSESDYRNRCIEVNLGNVEINFYIKHHLNEKSWAEYMALREFYTIKELDALKDAAGDDGILDRFHQEFGSWELYYYEYLAGNDGTLAYC